MGSNHGRGGLFDENFHFWNDTAVRPYPEGMHCAIPGYTNPFFFYYYISAFFLFIPYGSFRLNLNYIASKGFQFIVIMSQIFSHHCQVMEELKLDPSQTLLCQGTLRPDLIESASHLASSKAQVIKTHHNDSPLIRALREQGKVIEPLKDFHKDEVRFVLFQQLKPTRRRPPILNTDFHFRKNNFKSRRQNEGKKIKMVGMDML